MVQWPKLLRTRTHDPGSDRVCTRSLSHSDLDLPTMHVRSLGLFCAVALCFVAVVSATAVSSTVKTGIAMRALQQSGPNTDMTSGIIDGISVRNLILITVLAHSALQGIVN